MTETPNAERYVAGTLSEEEVARFEAAMIERPELAADVNVRRRIKSGLSLLEERKELDALLGPARPKPTYLRYAAAAAVLVAVMGLWSAWQREPVPLQALFNSNEIGAVKVAASFMLVKTRSDDEHTFSVQRDEGPVRLQVLVDDPGAAPFVVRLAAGPEQEGASGFRESRIAQTTDGFAEIWLDPRTLDSGSYTLTLLPQTGDAQVFPFILRISP